MYQQRLHGCFIAIYQQYFLLESTLALMRKVLFVLTESASTSEVKWAGFSHVLLEMIATWLVFSWVGLSKSTLGFRELHGLYV